MDIPWNALFVCIAFTWAGWAARGWWDYRHLRQSAISITRLSEIMIEQEQRLPPR